MNIQSIKFYSKLMVRALISGQVNAYKLKALFTNLYYAWRRIPAVPYGPIALWVEPVNYCNLQCSGCWVPGKQKYTKGKPMSMETFKVNIDSVKDTLILLILQMSGEPFLHKSIFEMIRYASDNNIVVWTSTNGSYKTDEDWGQKVVDSKLNTLNISISGISQQSYKLYHQGGNVENVKENIRKIHEAKKEKGSKTPYLYFRILLTDKNKGGLRDVRKFASDFNIEIITRKIYRTYEYQGYPQEEIDESVIEITAEDEPKCLKNHCYGLWIASALKSNHEVIPCCYDWLYPPTMGIVDGSLTVKDIWNSRKFKQFRDAILKKRESFASCRYCDNTVGFKDHVTNTHITIKFKNKNSQETN